MTCIGAAEPAQTRVTEELRSKQHRKMRATRNRYPFFAFRMWQGMGVAACFRLLKRNHFVVSPTRIPLALLLCVDSIVNSALTTVQNLVFGRCIAAATIEEPPIFIIGHWRTGTTLLHELLALDERLTAPTTLQCFAPSHFLVSAWLLRTLTFFLPTNRPMDDMSVGWDHPQEDEFALMNLGLGSPYETLAFPNHRPVRNEFLNMTEVTERQSAAWKAGLVKFLQAVNFHSGGKKRLVLKSPPHTARLHILRGLFPDAQFIHLVRHPCDVFASTVQLWKALYETQGLQQPDFAAAPNGRPTVEDYVLAMMELLYRDFFTELSLIPPQQVCEVRYEDLVRAPLEEVDRIYRELNLGAFDFAEQKLKDHLRTLSEYTPNVLTVSDYRLTQVGTRWRWYMERYGYQLTSSKHAPLPLKDSKVRVCSVVATTQAIERLP
ncbi:MAG: sulfotransferase [Acidobacteria bacterium]|nr:MAG: sulfotransferase [Acidobacteriota bacterium]